MELVMRGYKFILLTMIQFLSLQLWSKDVKDLNSLDEIKENAKEIRSNIEGAKKELADIDNEIDKANKEFNSLTFEEQKLQKEEHETKIMALDLAKKIGLVFLDLSENTANNILKE